MNGSILRGADALVSDARAKVSEAKQLLRNIENIEVVTNDEAMGLCEKSRKNFGLLYEDIKQLHVVLNELDDRR